MSSIKLENEIRSVARDFGLNLLGFASAEPFSEWREEFNASLVQGLYPESMLQASQWMTEIPQDIVPGARSIIVGGLYVGDNHAASYYAAAPGLGRLACRGIRHAGRNAANNIASLLRKRGYIVDAAPTRLPYKAAAVRAGIGWQGRNGLLQTVFGSYIDLIVLVTDAGLEPDTPLQNLSCAGCRACIDACPTGALRDGSKPDYTRCIAYYCSAVRSRVVPRPLRSKVKSMIYYCDICQRHCPNNGKAGDPGVITPDYEVSGLFRIEEILSEDQISFEQRMKRMQKIYNCRFPNQESLIRNAILVAGNQQLRSSTELLEKFLNNGSQALSLHAAWALGRIQTRPAMRILMKTEHHTSNPVLRKEITAGLKEFYPY